MSETSGPPVPEELRRLIDAEADRHTSALVRLIRDWPNFRKHIAGNELGSAIGLADMMGMDVDAFLVHLRKRCGKAAERVPPKGS